MALEHGEMEHTADRKGSPNKPRHVLFSQSYSIFSYNSFSSGRMGSHKDGISQFEMIHGLLLESVQFERILTIISQK